MNTDGKREIIYRKLRDDFGDAGIFAFEGMCLTQHDIELGYQHVLEAIAPALEEEMIADGSLDF